MTDEQMLFATEDQQFELQETVVAEANTEKYLIFVSDGLRYGLNAEQVAEIITNYSITPCPGSPTTSAASSTCAARSSPSWISVCVWASPLRMVAASSSLK